MRVSVVLFCLVIMVGSCTSNTEIPLPQRLAKLPIGLEISHSKQEVMAVLNSDYPARGAVYKWVHQTSVMALEKDLEMKEFGGFVLDNGEWVEKTIDSRPFTKEEFVKWYSCPKGRLRKGKKYTDPNNWTTSNTIPPEDSKSLFYYIAIDKDGNEFVGYKEIVLKAMLEEN